MFNLPDKVTLTDVVRKSECDASIVSLTREIAKHQMDAAWWQIGGSKSDRQKEGDHAWSWTRIVGEVRQDRFAKLVAVQTPDGEIQGAIKYLFDGESLLQPGEPSIFVEYLAAAPQNREWLVNPPKYRGVGTALVFYAVCDSWISGRQGRVTLVSLSSEKTREFYTRRGFSEVSTLEDGNVEFEMTSIAAERWLRQRGMLK
ncbi:MAG TPA: hypothetical protein PK992_11060 [Planctomycetaceae bacterium]|jgi:hypothetical protein|nr:hypothetical protein [Planctomycetaceae bacterium]